VLVIVVMLKYFDAASQGHRGNGQQHVGKLPTASVKMRLYQNLLLSKTTKLKAHDVLLTNSSASWWTSSNEADDSSNKINNISLTTAFATVNEYVHRNKIKQQLTATYTWTDLRTQSVRA